jgi:hypothetical protein
MKRHENALRIGTFWHQIGGRVIFSSARGWPENCMRHSFVSYRLAATQNAPQTALESGHDQAVLFKHYRELVRPKDAERFFSIRPPEKDVEEKIASISAG